MGAWILEQNIGVTFGPTNLTYFKGSLYLATGDGRIYRRVGTTWNLVRNVAAVYSQNIVSWQGYLWTFDDDEIYRSIDGTTWVADVDLRALNGDVTYTIETVNNNNTKLFASGLRAPGGATYYYERDTLGNWTLSPPTSPGAGFLTTEYIEWGNYYYYCRSGVQFYRWTGAAWQAVPGIAAQQGWCTVQGNVMWVKLDSAAPNCWIYWVNPDTDAWTQIYNIAYDSSGGRVSIDVNGQAWFAANNGVWTVVYVHYPSADPADGWVRHSRSAVGGGDGRIAGALDEDTIFLVNRTNNVIYIWTAWSWAVHPPSAGIGAGFSPQVMDSDGDGDRLYIGLYDNAGNTPRLISVATPLDGIASVGFLMFDPGAGTAINVRCPVIGDSIAISGHFGANEQVETSGTSGATWTDIDPGTWGAALAQPLVVDPVTLDEAMIALTPQSIIETLDSGTTWTVHNAAVGFSPGAMVKLVNGNEMIIGDDGANVILYSPNRGVSTANVTGAFGGNVAALEIT